MQVREKEILLPAAGDHRNLLDYISNAVSESLATSEYPIRLAVTKMDSAGYHCELGTLYDGTVSIPYHDSVFHFQRRSYENTNEFNAVFLVPTGIGAQNGGHSGDATPAARLIAECCDTIILHPNVVNAADLNEMPDNALYVEGSVIARLMMGSIALQRSRMNRVLLILDKHEDSFFIDAAINSANAARAAFGLNCPRVLCLDDSFEMKTSFSSSGSAVGRIDGLENLWAVLDSNRSEYDAIALSSIIQVPSSFHSDYFDQNDMVNPWGGVEAMLTHTVSSLFNVPSAHSPMISTREILDLDVGVVDPRKSAEAVSTTYLHCILRGLHQSPRIITNINLDNTPSNLITATDISCLVMPDRCVGLPTLAAIEQGITVIAVRDDENVMQNDLEALPFRKGQLFIVDNYFEAAGVITALKAGISIDTVSRPIRFSTVERHATQGIEAAPGKTEVTDNNEILKQTMLSEDSKA